MKCIDSSTEFVQPLQKKTVANSTALKLEQICEFDTESAKKKRSSTILNICSSQNAGQRETESKYPFQHEGKRGREREMNSLAYTLTITSQPGCRRRMQSQQRRKKLALRRKANGPANGKVVPKVATAAQMMANGEESREGVREKAREQQSN